MRRILFSFGLLALSACVVPAELRCEEGTPADCEGSVLVTCQGGFLVREDCRAAACDETLAVCGAARSSSGSRTAGTTPPACGSL